MWGSCLFHMGLRVVSFRSQFAATEELILKRVRCLSLLYIRMALCSLHRGHGLLLSLAHATGLWLLVGGPWFSCRRCPAGQGVPFCGPTVACLLAPLVLHLFVCSYAVRKSDEQLRRRKSYEQSWRA